jgi:hypothetical protein
MDVLADRASAIFQYLCRSKLYLLFNIAGGAFAGNSTVDGSTRQTGAMDRIGGPRERDPPLFVLGLDLLFRCLHFASGSGRSWNFNTLGFVPLPPSMWKGVRLPKVAHSPLPLQPAFGLSMRSSKKPRGLPPSIHDFDQYRNAARALYVFSIHDQPVRRIFWFGTTSIAAAAYNVSGAMSAPFGQAMVGPSIKNFLK